MASRLVKLATCALNQHVLDWEGNLERIRSAILESKRLGCKMVVTSELSITGYGLLDHFLEADTYQHSMEMLARLMSDPELHGILIDVGMPVMHQAKRFNCRVILLNGRIQLIRPKLHLANDGNFREMRYFCAAIPKLLETMELDPEIAALQQSRTVPWGDALLVFEDTVMGIESCEELFTPQAPHSDMAMQGAEIIVNSSGSHHSLRKLDLRLSLIQEAGKKAGGVYVYSNQIGCDGDRLYYDGSCLVTQNADILAQGLQFSLNEVNITTAVCDLTAVRTYRYAPAAAYQSMSSTPYPRIQVPFSLSNGLVFDPNLAVSPSRPIRQHSPEEEIALGPAHWCFDYLRRSKAAGFMIPLSGGIDSCATSVIIYSMCRCVVEAIKDGTNKQLISDVQRIAGAYEKEGWLPKTPQELCRNMLHTVYLGMRSQSSKETRSRALRLSQAIGAYHVDTDIDEIFGAHKALLASSIGHTPAFAVHGGSDSDDLALQNIQARSRMVSAYSLAQTLPSARKRRGGGGLLVLDINPIGSISKTDLKRFIAYARDAFDLPILEEFLTATPTAELRPITEDYVQSDEADMGLTYAELSILGRLRKEQRLGPFGIFSRLLHDWRDEKTPRETAVKVKRFIHFYAINRHKTTVLTPAYHAELYSCDDNRWVPVFCEFPTFLNRIANFIVDMICVRSSLVDPPFFQNWSFKRIDEEVDRLEAAGYGISKD